MQSARAFTALAHTQNGCIYGIFYQSMLKQTLACVQSHQSLHCSNTCTKWAYIWHIPSVNDQTRLSMHTVSQEPSLLSHMRKLGVHTAYSLRQYLVCMQSCQSLHCSHTCTKWAYIWHIPSINAHTRLSMRAVSQEPSLLSHMHKMGVHMAYSFSQSSNVP